MNLMTFMDYCDFKSHNAGSLLCLTGVHLKLVFLLRFLIMICTFRMT